MTGSKRSAEWEWADQTPAVPSNQAQFQPGAQQTLPADAPSLPKAKSKATTPKKKFRDMGVLECNAFLTEMEKRDFPVIFQAMLDAERVEHDLMKQTALQTALAGALRGKKPSPEFLEQLRAFVTNSSNSQSDRDWVFGALGHAATPETVELLAHVATSSPDPKIRESAAGSLGTVGAGMGAGEKLSPILERVWRESSDPVLLRSVSPEMAKVGAASSIELLLTAALATDDRDKVRHDVARDALREVYQDNAVPPLAARLANQPPTSEAVKLVAPLLARISNAAANKALVGWLQGRSENAAPLVHDLIVQHMLDDPFKSAWADALDPNVPFKNEENRKAIRTALDAYRAGRTSVPPK